VEFGASPGSGLPVVPAGISLQFIANRKLEFAALADKPSTNDRVWTVQLESGDISETMRPHERPRLDFAIFDGVPAPDYLQPYLKNLRHFGRGGLAPAFLMHLGILKTQPEFPDCEAGVSPNGRHILYKAKEGPLADVFIYGKHLVAASGVTRVRADVPHPHLL
jgi:hypothetical protein